SFRRGAAQLPRPPGAARARLACAGPTARVAAFARGRAGAAGAAAGPGADCAPAFPGPGPGPGDRPGDPRAAAGGALDAHRGLHRDDLRIAAADPRLARFPGGPGVSAVRPANRPRAAV